MYVGVQEVKCTMEKFMLLWWPWRDIIFGLVFRAMGCWRSIKSIGHGDQSKWGGHFLNCSHWLISRSWAKNSLSSDREKGGLGTSWSNNGALKGISRDATIIFPIFRNLHIVDILESRPPYSISWIFFSLWFQPSYTTCTMQWYIHTWATFSVLNLPTMFCEFRIDVTSG